MYIIFNIPYNVCIISNKYGCPYIHDQILHAGLFTCRILSCKQLTCRIYDLQINTLQGILIYIYQILQFLTLTLHYNMGLPLFDEELIIQRWRLDYFDSDAKLARNSFQVRIKGHPACKKVLIKE